MKYSFSPLDFNSIILVPPVDAADTRPAYHISHQLNGFMPFSMITVVRRGGLDTGEIVGDFQIGIINRQATVMFKGTDHSLDMILLRRFIRDGIASHTWEWRPPRGQAFFWSDFKYYHPMICWIGEAGKDKPLGKFYSAAKKTRKRGGQPVEESMLEMFPSGYEHFDHILLSSLILERLRLVPESGKYGANSFKDLWNYWPYRPK